MKKIILLLVCIVLIATVYLLIEGNKKLEITSVIDISAPPSKVWNIITDVNKWQQWSPIINSSSGESSIGSTLNITMMSKEVGEDGPQYSPVITDLTEAKYFRWRANMVADFIFTNEKIFTLEETSTGTRLIHTETFKGLLAPIFCIQMEAGVPPMLNSMNAALKAQAEK